MQVRKNGAKQPRKVRFLPSFFLSKNNKTKQKTLEKPKRKRVMKNSAENLSGIYVGEICLL